MTFTVRPASRNMPCSCAKRIDHSDEPAASVPYVTSVSARLCARALTGLAARPNAAKPQSNSRRDGIIISSAAEGAELFERYGARQHSVTGRERERIDR